MRPSRVVPFALIILGIVIIPRLAWWDRTPVNIELGIAGPSPAPGVSHPPVGLEWILRHLKARPPIAGGFGLSPGAIVASELKNLSAVYLFGGLAESMGSEAESGEGDFESHIDKWLVATEARALTAFTSRGGATLAEGGVLPAVGDSEALWRVEDCFRVRWTGWSGLSVDDIGDPSQTPPWILALLREAGDMTTVGGPAVILFKGEQILVLRGDLEIEPDIHEIVWRESTKLISRKGMRGQVSYRGWFDIVRSRGGCEVLADHKLHVTEWGAKKLEAAGLSDTFPCFLGYRGAHVSYYLAGTFSSDGPSDIWVRVAGYPALASAFNSYLGGEREAAFWGFYYPIMSRVILEAARSWKESGS